MPKRPYLDNWANQIYQNIVIHTYFLQMYCVHFGAEMAKLSSCNRVHILQQSLKYSLFCLLQEGGCFSLIYTMRSERKCISLISMPLIVLLKSFQIMSLMEDEVVYKTLKQVQQSIQIAITTELVEAHGNTFRCLSCHSHLLTVLSLRKGNHYVVLNSHMTIHVEDLRHS